MAIPSTRAEALEKGEMFYSTGQPCKRGHVALRLAKGGKCVQCNREQCQRHYEKNAEAIIAQKREYQAENREQVLETRARFREVNRERLREECRAYHASHRAERSAYSRVWRASLTPEERKAHDKKNHAKHRAYRLAKHKEWMQRTGYQWHQVNPEGQAAKNARRRAKIRQAEGFYTEDDVARISKAQGGRCACCKRKAKLAVDHIVPLAKGGSNWPSNLQLLCKPCNGQKAARDPIEFMQSKGALL